VLGPVALYFAINYIYMSSYVRHCFRLADIIVFFESNIYIHFNHTAAIQITVHTICFCLFYQL